MDSYAIHVLELKKWKRHPIKNDLDRWIRFFREGEEYDDEKLPKGMNTEEMIQAMATLRKFSEREREQDLYQRRVEYLSVQKTREIALKEALEVKEKERAEKELALKREEEATKRAKQAEEKAEKLLNLLKSQGLDPEKLL